jgi:hypothetical protein
MIVLPAALENGRTVWNIESETADAPAPALWLEGFARDVPETAEAIFIALALGPHARRRLVLPCFAGDRLREALEQIVGVAIVAGEARKPEPAAPGEFSIAMVRDELDIYLASIAKAPANFLVGVHTDLTRVGEVSTTFRTASNAGLLRRGAAPLDGVGELGVMQMLSHALMAGSLAAYSCREELGNVGAAGLARLTRETGVALSLPFAGVSVASLGRVLVELGLHPVACFRGLWKRYQFFPDVIGTIYRDLEDSLLGGDLAEDPSFRVAAEMARIAGARRSARPACGDALDLAFHAAQPRQRLAIG